MSKFKKRVSRSDFQLLFWMIFIAITNGASQGYDSSLIAGLQILPGYKSYFHPSTALISLNVAISAVGSTITVPIASWIPNKWGRKWGLATAALVSIVGAAIQGAATHEAMFCIGRLLIGVSGTVCAVVVPTYLAEVSPPKHRAQVTSLCGTMWGVGAILAAIVTFGTQYMSLTWSWRTPSLLQCLPAILCLVPLPFVPESPRWLMYMGREEATRAMLVKHHADGDSDCALVTAEFEEIRQTIEFEKRVQNTKYKALLGTRPNRGRFGVCLAIAIFSKTSGFIIVTSFLGQVLTQAGIFNVNKQLAINIGLNVWELGCAIIGSIYMDQFNRRLSVISTTSMLSFTLILMAILTKLYIKPGMEVNISASYAIVFLVYFFCGWFALVWIPMSTLYSSEVLSYSLRTNGLSLSSGLSYAVAVFISYMIPYGMKWSVWGFYLINGVWCLIECVIMWLYFPETRGMTLEEIDVIFDGKNHFNHSSPNITVSEEREMHK